MRQPLVALPWRRIAAELTFLIGLGLVMAVVGPYATGLLPAKARIIYWLLCIVGGGLIGVAIDETLGRRIPQLWPRVIFTSVAMTPLVALLVICVGAVLIVRQFQPNFSPGFLGQVFVISVLVMSMRALTWRSPQTVVETRVVIAPPLPEAEAAFRRRLSSKRRSARIIALHAEDHYLRVFTDAGDELLTFKFTDAVKELSDAHGFQTHRSWWIAADAIEDVRWRKGVGEARLAGGLVAPVSRSHAAKLREAGWF